MSDHRIQAPAPSRIGPLEVYTVWTTAGVIGIYARREDAEEVARRLHLTRLHVSAVEVQFRPELPTDSGHELCFEACCMSRSVVR